MAPTYKSEKRQIFKEAVNGDQFKRTQRMLVKTLSNFSPKKASDVPISKVFSFRDVKKESKYQSDEDIEEKKPKVITKSNESSSESDSDDNVQQELMNSNTASNAKLLNPLVQAVVSLIIQLFDFKEQHAWLKENAALKLLHKFTGTMQTPEL